MEKLNLVKILKDCPKGTKLYSPALGECALEGVNDNNDYPIKVTYKIINNDTRFDYFTKYGYLLINKPDAECMLFPSKDQRDWSKWQRPFVDGDIVFVRTKDDSCVDEWVSIFKEYGDCDCKTYFDLCLATGSFFNEEINILCEVDNIQVIRLATEEEKEKLFQAIKDNGYQWNAETKTLEKLVEQKFNDGDVVTTKSGLCTGIVRRHVKLVDDAYQTYIAINGESLVHDDNIFYFERLATEEEKQKLFKVLEKNGYKWNSETKTLEELPKFKVGDKIKHKDTVLTIITVRTDSYIIEDKPDNFGILMFSQQDKWELINEPKFKVGDRIRYAGEDFPIKIIDIKNNQYHIECFCDKYNDYKNGIIPVSEQNNYMLIPKFDPKTLQPFDKVLVRDNDTSIWVNAFFGFYDIEITKKYPFVASGINWTQCIPYEGNEHLLGTYEDCDEYYKNWL